MTKFGKELIIFWATLPSARFAAVGKQCFWVADGPEIVKHRSQNGETKK
jgi:hypothetical protein